MKLRKAFLLTVSLLVLSLAAGAQERFSSADYQKVSDTLVCQCGCSLNLSTCAMEGCHSATPMRAEVRKRLAGGESVDTIVASFVDRYGIQILSAPPASGFNLSAWVMPFFVLLVGLVVIKAVLSSWKRRAEPLPAEAAASSEVPDDVRKRVEKELQEY